MCEEIVIFHPEILEESFLKLPMLERVLAFKTLIDKNFAKLHSPYWINFCQNIIDNIDWTTLGGLSGEMLLLAADVLDEIKKDVDWEIIYACFAKLVEHNRRTCDNFGKMINMCLQKIPDIIFEYAMEANFKKVHKDIRMEVYSAIIGAGLFDVQLARRIRSDSSMYVSSICIESFFKEIENYDNKEKLLEQFLDTRYDPVIKILIEKAPVKYLPFFVGITDVSCKKLLEKRMQSDIIK